ncbi:hypothetical protein HN51_052248, partial [Arachis hypogaea]
EYQRIRSRRALMFANQLLLLQRTSQGSGPRLIAVSISFDGMLIFAMMLGLVVSDAISGKFDSMRKGKSEVVEQNHTSILGWSGKLGSLLNQLAIPNESLGGGTVVVMAESASTNKPTQVSPTCFQSPDRRIFLPEGLLDRSKIPPYLTGEVPGGYGYDPFGLRKKPEDFAKYVSHPYGYNHSRGLQQILIVCYNFYTTLPVARYMVRQFGSFHIYKKRLGSFLIFSAMCGRG